MYHYGKLVAKNYTFTKCSITDSYCENIDDNKVIAIFAEECCMFTDSDSDKTSSADLFSAYCEYCHLQRVLPLNQNNFSEKFGSIFSEKVIKGKIRVGIKSVNGFKRVKLKGISYNSALKGIH